ncbi:MAG: DAK2 domain-containing protein [Eubacteriales bacterium]|nr:DAK2 domain-containing protein [Eubacteriales bacterium]
METERLNGNLFANMMRGGSLNIRQNRSIVNDLNVFPIPDGDTGDNMYMTVEAGCNAACLEHSDSLESVSASAAHGMLLGARGNSGVILSRIFAGIAEGFKGCPNADVKSLGAAFERGVSHAYGAVSVPIEGTILTVYKDAVRYANSLVTEDSTLHQYFNNFTLELRRSLERTPELLAVLKEAGVVDSGGAGFVYIIEGMKNVLDGVDTPFEEHTASGTSHKTVDTSSFNENSVMTFGYCTEFLLQLQSSKVDIDSFDIADFSNYLNSIGDSVVVFLDGSIVKVHVHTMTPGVVLGFGQAYGEYLTVKIENMTLQHNDVTIQNRFSPPKIERKRAFGIVAVACGAGIKQTFTDLGASYVVEGGQCMNPSAEDFIRAFDEVNAETIFVLPNNGNILLTARQAAELYDKSDIRVIPSRTIGDGYAALSMYDDASGDADQIEALAIGSMEGVVTGEISRAIRDSSSNGLHVSAGEYIGIARGKIHCAKPDRTSAVADLCQLLDAGSRDVMILVRGSDAPVEEAEQLCADLGAQYKRTEVILLDGGQAVYDYIIIFE